MPLYGGPYFSSSSYLQSVTRNPRAGLAAIRLWWHAWHQIPAASLPSDDAELAVMADFGSDISAWLACKEIALRGFILCSDQRLYHKTLSVIAMEKYTLRLKKATRRKKDNDRLREWRSRAAGTDSDAPACSDKQGNIKKKKTRNAPETRFMENTETHSVSRVESESESESETDLLGQRTPRFTLPDFIPADAWADYVAMRKKIRRPMTERAVTLSINTLKRMMEDGADVRAVLQQSVMHSWTGLHPLKNTDMRVKRVSQTNHANSSGNIARSFKRLLDQTPSQPDCREITS